MPTLRDWLTRKQRETRRGRAELRLEERSEVWNLQPRADYLPPWWELAAILALTNRRLWTPPQRKLVRASLRWQAARGLLVAACLVLLLAGAWEANGRIRARTLVDRLVAAETPRVPAILRELAPYRRPAGGLLRQSLLTAPTGSTAATNIRLALLDDDPSQAESLLERALIVDGAEFSVLRDALVGHSERVAGGLWALVDDAAAEPRRRLAAAKLLAEFMRTINGPQADEWHARFRKSGPFIVNQLLETAVHGTAEFDGLLQGLKPAGGDLLGALRSAYHDRQQDPSLKTIALNLAATFAADDVAALTDVVLTSADPARLDEYLPRFAADRQATVAALTAEIEGDPDQSSEPDWNDVPLDPSWSAPLPKYQRMLEAAVGMLAERFAFCQTMPLDEFVEVLEGLRPAGYRPIHVRPFVLEDEILMAAVWTRDALDWRFAHDLSAADVLKTQEEWKRDGHLPIDLAGYPRADFRFALLAARDAELAEIDLIVGAPTANVMNEFQDRNRRGFTILTIQASLDEQNHHRQSQVWYKARTAATHHGSAWLVPATEATFEATFRQAVLPLVDACVLPAETKPPRERYLEYIANIDELLARKSDSAAIRKNRGYWQLQLGQDEQARDDFSEALSKEPKDALALLWRAIAQARLGQAEAARQDVGLASKLGDENPKIAALESVRFWKIVASAYLDAPISLEEQIESELKAAPDDPNRLLQSASIYAWCAKALSEKDQTRSTACFDRSVALFREALAIVPDAFENPRVKNELEGLLFDLPAFQELLQQHNRRYISLQATSRDRMAFESHGLSPEDHLKRCRELAAQQCRPVSMSAGSMGVGQPLATVSVWQRPILAEERRDELALRRAHAAIALLKLDEGSSVWPLFRAAADPRLRAYLIEAVAKFGVEPRLLLARFGEEPDSGARQALVLALAGYTPAALGDSESRRLSAELGERFRRDPDPGVHSAIGWLLEKSGRHSEVRQAQTELASGAPEPSRGWYVNGQGQTLAVVDGPAEFDMGSPYYETNKNFNEPLHRRRIGRTFAIATHEVTSEQFTRFLDDHPNLRNSGHGQAGTDPHRPIGSVTWYEAAQYCRWLSEREGIPEDQMFYPPVEQIKQGVPLESDLEKTGYRLSTEAEWELACRAGTVTAYSFGGTTNLAPQYSWSKETSGDRLRAVGLLKPNAWGLFDMHGNIEEWCHSRYEANLPAADAAGVVVDGLPSPGTIDTLVRVMRGGEFRNSYVEMRSANRKSVFAGTRDLGNGFRVARTLSVTPIEEEK